MKKLTEKKEYMKPACNLVAFDEQDVVTASDVFADVTETPVQWLDDWNS